MCYFPSYGRGMGASIKYPVIAITGPTATGKTDAAIELALRLSRVSVGFQIVNFDSLCFYRELRVGTARPSKTQMQGLPHALMGHESIRSPLNAARFCEQALPLIESLHQKRQIPILVGGSAFYLRALVKGMYASAALTKNYDKSKVSVHNLGQIEGRQAGATEACFLHVARSDSAVDPQNGLKCEHLLCGRDYLKKHDPESYQKIHKNDHYRINRAVEYHRQTGRPISFQKQAFEDADPYDFSRPQVYQWQVLTLYLDMPKEEHWKVIEKRTERMLKNGLLEETQDLLARGFSGREKPLLSVGYKEVQDYLRGNLTELENLRERIFLSTRQLAKSQRTFLKKSTPKRVLIPL